jgi:hypothetical protein
MGKFDHLSKLQVQAELRRIENIPREFWGEEVQALRDRLDAILEEEKQAEVARDERKHREAITAARRSRVASFLSVAAAVASAIAAGVSAYYAIPHSSTPISASPSPSASPTTEQTSSPLPPSFPSTPAPTSAEPSSTPPNTPNHAMERTADR